MQLRTRQGPYICYDCGGLLKVVSTDPETYRCECGYTIRRLTKEESKRSPLAFVEIENE